MGIFDIFESLKERREEKFNKVMIILGDYIGGRLVGLTSNGKYFLENSSEDNVFKVHKFIIELDRDYFDSNWKIIKKKNTSTEIHKGWVLDIIAEEIYKSFRVGFGMNISEFDLQDARLFKNINKLYIEVKFIRRDAFIKAFSRMLLDIVNNKCTGIFNYMDSEKHNDNVETRSIIEIDRKEYINVYREFKDITLDFLETDISFEIERILKDEYKLKNRIRVEVSSDSLFYFPYSMNISFIRDSKSDINFFV